MTGVIVTQGVVQVTVTPAYQPPLVLTVPAATQVTVQPLGAQGPPGPPGPSAEVVHLLAGGPVSALRVLSRGPAGAGLCDPASAGSMAAMIGISAAAAADGAQVEVRQAGIMTDASWAWTAGQPLFCGAAGALTATPPASPAIRQVAVALGATTILIDISDLILME